jgi:hypothetical protein
MDNGTSNPRDIYVYSAGFSSRTVNILQRRGLHTLGDVAAQTDWQLRFYDAPRSQSLGQWSLFEITRVLKDHGLELTERRAWA